MQLAFSEELADGMVILSFDEEEIGREPLQKAMHPEMRVELSKELAEEAARFVGSRMQIS